MLYTPYKKSQSISSRRKGRSVQPYQRKAQAYGRFAAAGQEMKFVDGDFSSGTIATGGEFIPAAGALPVIASGTSESQRIGRKVVIRKVSVRVQTTIPSKADPDTCVDHFRLMLVWDKQANGAIATVTGILESASMYSFNNLSNKDRFRILFDKFWHCNSQGAGYTGAAYATNQAITEMKSINVNCNIPIEYSGTDGTIDEMMSNNLVFLVISTAGVGLMTGKYRLRYTDA